MGKRSRDASFSPTAAGDESSQGTLATSPDAEQPPPNKLVVDGSASSTAPVMKCSLPPHRDPLEFETLDAFDVHYAKEHTNRCAECSKNFPSAHILALHLEENHNPLREALQERGEKTYACFIPDCDRKCSTPQKRRLHLIDKHAFPRFYNFRVVDYGIDKSTTLLKESNRRRISTSTDTTPSVGHRRRTSTLFNSASQVPKDDNLSTSRTENENASANDEVDSLEKSMSALKFVPPSVTRRSGKQS